MKACRWISKEVNKKWLFESLIFRAFFMTSDTILIPTECTYIHLMRICYIHMFDAEIRIIRMYTIDDTVQLVGIKKSCLKKWSCFEKKWSDFLTF